MFTLDIDDLTRHVQDEGSWCMLFANYTVLVYETRAVINYKLEFWRELLESKGLQLSRIKTEYM